MPRTRIEITPLTVRGVAFVHLTKGHRALIDANDWPSVSGWNWTAQCSGVNTYAVRRANVDGKLRLVGLHRQLIGSNAGKQVDHINGNGLDNRRRNLRECDQTQNLRNRTRSTSASGFKGVSKTPEGRWFAQLKTGGRNFYLGLHPTPEEAARAYDAAAKIAFGEFAHTNF